MLSGRTDAASANARWTSGGCTAAGQKDATVRWVPVACPQTVRMGAFTMSETERDEFLAALHVGVLAVERPDGPPLVAPVWYRYEPGGPVEFSTERSSEKARLIERSGHASLCVQREDYPYAYVTVEGPTEISPTDRATRVDIAARYLGAEMGAAYVDGTAGDNIVVRIRPARWRTTDYSTLELPGAG
jgi:PPOX class probable F420-dependent enzyme